MANDREDHVNAKTFWTVCSALCLLTIGSFGHSQFLDSGQTEEKREWRKGFKYDVKDSIDGVKQSVKELKQEQREQVDRIRDDTGKIQESLNRLLLTDRNRERTR